MIPTQLTLGTGLGLQQHAAAGGGGGGRGGGRGGSLLGAVLWDKAQVRGLDSKVNQVLRKRAQSIAFGQWCSIAVVRDASGLQQVPDGHHIPQPRV